MGSLASKYEASRFEVAHLREENKRLRYALQRIADLHCDWTKVTYPPGKFIDGPWEYNNPSRIASEALEPLDADRANQPKETT